MRIQQNGKLVPSALVVALLLVTARTLAAQDVRYNFMPGADFSKYHTYKWVNIRGDHPDQIMDAEIKQAVDSQLAAKGMSKSDSDKADLYIGYRAAINLEKSVNLRSTGMDPGGLGWGDRSVQGQTSTVPVGLLFVDMYDRATKQLVWRGDVSKSLDLNKNPEKNYKNLQKAMAKLLKNYPRRADK